MQITDALNQAKIKKEINVTEGLQPSITQTQNESPPAPRLQVPSPFETPVPKPSVSFQMPQTSTPVNVTAEYPTYPYQYPTAEESPKMETEAIEEIAEEIVNEKWSEIKGKISDVIEWKIYAEKRITSVDERIKRIEVSMDRLQAAMLTKVQEYGRNIKDLGAEMAGLEGAFGKVLTPFVENMRELSRITGDLKNTQNKPKPQANKPKPAKTVTTTTTTSTKPKAHRHKAKSKVIKEVTKVTKTVKK